jgi:hypothetical protein
MQKNDKFKVDTLTICDMCYVDLLGHKKEGGNQVINISDHTVKLKGTGGMMPGVGV